MITGRKVLIITVSAFSIIIGVNLTLAYNAVSTFPGLEVKNSYVASQQFEANRSAQEALGWNVDASVEDGVLTVAFTDDAGAPVEVARMEGILGRATHVQQDQTPEFTYRDGTFRAPVTLADGNWNLRMVAHAPDGTEFRQRVVLRLID